MKFLEKLKDILYDSIDYVIMLTIVVIVVFVIGWRLDVLFAKDAYEPKDNDTVIVDNSARPKPNEDVHNPENNEELENPDEDSKEPTNPVEPANPEEPTKPVEPTPPASVEAEVVKVKIPDGSLPGNIGNILADYGLVSSSKDFVNKAVEMKLETRLRSGSFEIPKGSNIEQVVRIIAKR